LDAVGQEQLAFEKQFMVVTSLIRALGDSLETIEVQLSLKGRELALLHVGWHDMFDKLLWLMYDKASSVWLPRHNVTVTIMFDLAKYLVKLDGKGGRDTPASNGLQGSVIHILKVIMIVV
jgi:hypothetical protein